MYTKVRLYYPNRWRQNISDVAEEHDKKFSWYICSKVYEDPDTHIYISEIAPGTRFYDEVSGINYILGDVAKLMIVDNIPFTIENTNIDPVRVQELGYQGIACLTKCDSPSRSIICPEAIFCFINGVLKIDNKKALGCPIITYAKSNYKCIKSKIPDFPSSNDIDEVLAAGYSLTAVCKVLYDDIAKYMELI